MTNKHTIFTTTNIRKLGHQLVTGLNQVTKHVSKRKLLKTRRFISSSIRLNQPAKDSMQDTKSKQVKRYLQHTIYTIRIKRRPLTFIALLLIIVITPLAIYISRQANVASAWWNDSWDYRKLITISNSGNTLTDHLVSFSLGALDSQLIRTDCGDVRVTDEYGQEISDPYWVDCAIHTSPTVWVKLGTIPTGDSNYYVYYGNPTATRTNDQGDTLFPDFFEDFAGTVFDTDTFTSGGGGTITQNEYLSITNNADAWDQHVFKTDGITRADDVVLHTKVKIDSGTRSMVGWHDSGTGTGQVDIVYAFYFSLGTLYIHEDGTNRGAVDTYSYDTWYDLKLELKATGATYYYKLASSNNWTQIYDSVYSSEATLKPGVVHYDVTEKTYLDSWLVTTYSATDPTITVAAAEIGPRLALRAWWNDNWSYRNQITISNSGSELTDHLVSFSLGSLDSKQIRTDCGDIRITGISGQEIDDPYWVDCAIYTSPTVWIKFSSIPSGEYTYFAYYGNPAATRTNDQGDSFFPDFFEDFTGTTFDTGTFTSGGGGTITQSNYLSIINNNDAWDQHVFKTVGIARSDDKVLYTKVKVESGTRSMVGWHDSGTGTGYADHVYTLYFNNGTFYVYEDNTSRGIVGTYTAGTWYDVKIELKSTGAKYFYKEASSNTWTEAYDSSYSSEATLKPGVAHLDAGEHTYLDSWLVTTYAATDPTLTVAATETGLRPALYWSFNQGNTQDVVEPITAIEHHIDLLSAVYDPNTAGTTPSDDSLGHIRWDADLYPDSTVYFESMCRSDGSNSDTFVYLREVGGGIVYTSWECPRGSWATRRSAALTLTDDTDYSLRMYTQNGTGIIKTAKLVVVQNNPEALTQTTSQIELGANESTDSTTYTQLTDKKIYHYDSSVFDPAPTAKLQAMLKGEDPKIEQQINIINKQHVQAQSSGIGPTDNSLGAFKTVTTGDYFNGLIDDIRIYNYALSPDQIKIIMNNGAVRFR
jgi:hypothetical protein